MAYTQVTLSTLQDRLADRYESVPYWSTDEATRALNEGLRLWSALTGFWRSTVLLTATPNDPYVPLPSTILRSARLTWNGLPLEPASLADFDYGFPNWRLTTTATAGAPSRPVYWAPLSLNLLAIYPADAEPSNVNDPLHQIVVDGLRQTPVLVDPADFVDLGQEELGLLLGYAQHVLAFKVGGQTLVASYPGWRAFLQAGADRNSRFAASAFYRRIMGLDQQRRLFANRVPRDEPASQAAAALSGGGPGEGGAGGAAE